MILKDIGDDRLFHNYSFALCHLIHTTDLEQQYNTPTIYIITENSPRGKPSLVTFKSWQGKGFAGNPFDLITDPLHPPLLDWEKSLLDLTTVLKHCWASVRFPPPPSVSLDTPADTLQLLKIVVICPACLYSGVYRDTLSLNHIVNVHEF